MTASAADLDYGSHSGECEVVMGKFCIALTIYKKNLSILLKIYKYTMQKESCSNLIQIFLEQSKQCRELEEFFAPSSSKVRNTILLHTKLTIIFVLFVLNYVSVFNYQDMLVKIFEKCFEGFMCVLSWVRKTAGNDVSKTHKVDEQIMDIASATNCKFVDSTHSGELIKLLGDIDLSMKQHILKICHHIYRSSDIIWKIEALFSDFEHANLHESLVKAFEIFEDMLKDTGVDASKEMRESIPQEAELNDSSFYYDHNDPNFILQPLKAEKYLAEKAPDAPKLTLVLDLDETLVHFEEKADGGEFLVRPYASEFITRMAESYEIIVFTAAIKEYADWIIDRIDPNSLISSRLYRNHTYFQNGTYIKDLARLGRDLSKTIIVDNNIENFQLQPENGIYIKTWLDDPNDTALSHLARVLMLVASKDVGDIRAYLAELQIKMDKRHRDTA